MPQLAIKQRQWLLDPFEEISNLLLLQLNFCRFQTGALDRPKLLMLLCCMLPAMMVPHLE